ncbi:MAG: Nif3-like dinuclear metal center hexameric protein [candidate division KSB1 bacterium]|nr:Nif3-like dinuclear metal center hexameric protein [candidate division KSB1 bacterium]MDZ7305138.1 Nif3-like dinuclear metal center hexameric protein [candidate division KSB1 bacterium]MDZ7314222.1 Nif3-like dinuclear metal center hexameric protein [candidate division KSB1 bacterium]
MHIKELTTYLDTYLQLTEFVDTSQNGLQVQGREEIHCIGASVDTCQETIDAAAAAKVDLLLVHHGLFWEKPEKIVGTHYHRVKKLLEAEINLYCAHLPLDAHPEVGNNAVLARRLGFEPTEGFGEHHGREIGRIAVSTVPISQGEFLRRLHEVLGNNIRTDFFGADTIQRIIVVTGGGAFLLPQVIAAGVDAYITGEPSHSRYHLSKENRLNVVYGGHYVTETFGVIALAQHLEAKFGLPYQFLDFPTGL